MDPSAPSVAATPVTSARWIAPVLAPALAVLVASGLLAPMPEGVQFSDVVRSAALWAVILVLITIGVGVLPLLFGSVRPAKRAGGVGRAAPGRVLPALLVVSGFLVLTALAGRTPRLAFFAQFEHNWQGKVVDLLWVGILFAVLWRWARDDAHLTWRTRPGSGRTALIVIGAVFVLFAGLTVMSVSIDPAMHQQVGAEQLLYNTTIPNLTEELIWRAAMLAVLDRAFGTPWRLAGAPVGWGLVVTSVAFGAGHLILLSANGEFSLSVSGGIFAALMGVLLAWIWAYTRSVWPAFLLHCAPEAAVDVGMLLTG
ncbi:CPBP family intramembrane glutamic endopeptidase [Ruania zhangjianzhongii]|uniref:CPBP family intramembrane glutamic endopeptidase n=1 Tax=Ruania zhangjianzhongii TaxID=2603206 RepID=UPI0011C7EC9A|nr:CPBP family intramembrane glutamic endopeptidase [Ruania zhangjianzhongii]